MKTNRHAMTLAATAGLLTFLIPTLASAETMYQLTSKGRGNIGFNSSLSFTSATNELEGGDTASNSTLFLLAAPKFGYFLANRIELAVQAGILMRRLQRGEDSSSTESAGLLDVGVNFNIPLNQHIALVPGLGLGGYLGGSSRPTTVVNDQDEVQTVNESTSTLGLDLYGQLNLSYRASRKTTLIAGLNLHYLYGTERAESSEEALRVSTLNTSLGVGVAYTF